MVLGPLAIGRFASQQREKPLVFTSGFSYKIRQRLTLPGPCGPSTISAERLNCRVRDGNGWDPLAIVTGKLKLFDSFGVSRESRVASHEYISLFTRDSRLVTRVCPLKTLQRFVFVRFTTTSGQVLDLLVPVSSIHCCTYTPGLSTW